MVLTWQQYYDLHKDNGNINEIASQYNMYVYQNEEQYDAELIRKMGTNIMILQENGYTLIQEGEHEYGLLQEIGNNRNIR
jgi:hypothetical protein